jgi:Polysaccharide deacetylase
MSLTERQDPAGQFQPPKLDGGRRRGWVDQRTKLARVASAMRRLFLNWGVLLLAVAVVLAFRYITDERDHEPLPAPTVQLTAATARQWRAFPSYAGTVPVLAYHGIAAAGRLSIQPQAFAEQMLALKTAGFHAITLAQYVNFVTGRDTKLPSKPILLTFDDGRLDTYRVANNILRRYGFHATMFTFASWPVTHPGFSLSWSELRSMQKSGIWSVQEHGGYGREYVTYNAAGAKGGVYAFREYIPTGNSGHLESYPSFVRRVTSNIMWGTRQLKSQIPGYRPMAFSIPGANYGQVKTNDPRIPQFMLPWLDQHFTVVFGGDYLAGHARSLTLRSSPGYSYRITVDSRINLRALNCRLTDWVTSTPIYKEYKCLHPTAYVARTAPLYRAHPEVPVGKLAPPGAV